MKFCANSGCIGGLSTRHRWLPVVVLLVVSELLSANIVTLDFEGLSDGDTLSNQIPGLTFTNATVLTAGLSLNELAFPPHSGFNVAGDVGGPINIGFSAPVKAVRAFFTYVSPLAITAYDANQNALASAASAFADNSLASGDVGSSPNELLGLTFDSGIFSVRIAGNLTGSSFSMDDLQLVSAVPEPATTAHMLIFAAMMAIGHMAARIWRRM